MIGKSEGGKCSTWSSQRMGKQVWLLRYQMGPEGRGLVHSKTVRMTSEDCLCSVTQFPQRETGLITANFYNFTWPCLSIMAQCWTPCNTTGLRASLGRSSGIYPCCHYTATICNNELFQLHTKGTVHLLLGGLLPKRVVMGQGAEI